MSSEFKPLDPSAQAGNADPTAIHPIEMITSLTEAERNNLIAGASARPSVLSFDIALGETLESQCNKNYAYLNGQGVGLEQFVGATKDFVGLFTDAVQVNKRQDGGEEILRKSRTISGSVKNPLTGEVVQDDSYDMKIRWPGKDEQVRTITGPVEMGLLERGVFKAPGEVDEPLSAKASRAEQILTTLRSSEAGQKILQKHGIDDPNHQPGQPITLVAEKVIAEVAPAPQVHEVPAPRSRRIGRTVLGRLIGRR